MSEPLERLGWAYAPTDRCWHVLPEGGVGPEARCGHPLPSGAQGHVTPPGVPCRSCAALVRAADPLARRGRLWVRCTRVDTTEQLSLMVTHEWNGAWTIHAPAAVRLNAADMAFMCAAVLMRSAQALRRAGQGDPP